MKFIKLIKSEIFTLILILIINFLIISFFFFNNKFIAVHDFTGGARVFELAKTLKAGQFPPRWSQNLGFGYGMPIFQFYAPLFFSLATFFYLIGLPIILSLKLVIFFTIILGFCGMYLLAKKITNHWGGLLAATAFTLAPYHAVNFYVRGAFSEALVISYFPWILFFSIKIIEEKYFKLKNYLYLTLFLSALFLTHNVTILTFLPIYLGGLFIMLFLFKKLPKFLTILISLIHSIVISAFFLFPAFLTKGFTRVAEITGGYSYYKLHFLYFRQLFMPNWEYGGSVWGIGDDMSFYLGNDILLIAVIASLLTIYSFWKKNRSIKKFFLDRKFILFLIFGFSFLLSIFLTSFKSQIIWDHLPLVSFIQFPWRFLGVASFFLAILTAYLTKYINKSIILILIVVIMIANGRFFHPKELYDPGDMYQPSIKSIENRMSGIIPDYLPKGIDWQKIKPLESVAIFNSGKLEVIKNNPQEVLLKIGAEKAGNLTINRFVFPNWRFKLDNQKITCKQKDFIYDCQIPQGQHILQVYWSERGINLISDIISLLGLSTVILLIIKNKKK